MRKHSKIIASALLLSLIVSLFVGFSAFAEDVEKTDASERVVVWSMDDQETIEISGALEGDSLIKTTLDDGQVVWQYKHDLTATAATSPFWNVTLPKANESNPVIIADVHHTVKADDGITYPADNDGDGEVGGTVPAGPAERLGAGRFRLQRQQSV